MVLDDNDPVWRLVTALVAGDTPFIWLLLQQLGGIGCALDF